MSQKSSIKDIFGVLLANPSIGRLIVEQAEQDGLAFDEGKRRVRVIVNDVNEFLAVFKSHVGKDIQWRSIYKRLRRAGFSTRLESDAGNARVFEAQLSTTEVSLLWNAENTQKPREQSKRAHPLSQEAEETFNAIRAVEQMLADGVKPKKTFSQRHHLAPPMPRLVLPEVVDANQVVSALDLVSPIELLTKHTE